MVAFKDNNFCQYLTQDGTCIRDYIHVQDVVNAITASLEALILDKNSGIYNVGSSIPTSVLEVVETTVSKLKISPTIHWADKRPGDPPILLANNSKFRNSFQWAPTHSNVTNIIATSIEYQKTK